MPVKRDVFLGVQGNMTSCYVSTTALNSTVDRIVLDVPEPWRVLDTAADVLIDGGIMAAYLPTVLQVHQHVTAARAHQNSSRQKQSKCWSVSGMSLTIAPAPCIRWWAILDSFASRRVGRPQKPEAETSK